MESLATEYLRRFPENNKEKKDDGGRGRNRGRGEGAEEADVALGGLEDVQREGEGGGRRSCCMSLRCMVILPRHIKS